MQGSGWKSQAFSLYEIAIIKGRGTDRRLSYNFQDVGDDAIRRDVAVILEEVSLGRT